MGWGNKWMSTRIKMSDVDGDGDSKVDNKILRIGDMTRRCWRGTFETIPSSSLANIPSTNPNDNKQLAWLSTAKAADYVQSGPGPTLWALRHIHKWTGQSHFPIPIHLARLPPAIHHYLYSLPILFSRYSYEVMKEIEGLGVGSPFDQASNCVGDVSEALVDLQSAASGCRNDGDVPVPIGKEQMGMWRCRSRRVGVSVRRVARGLINWVMKKSWLINVWETFTIVSGYMSSFAGIDFWRIVGMQFWTSVDAVGCVDTGGRHYRASEFDALMSNSLWWAMKISRKGQTLFYKHD